MAAIVSGHYCEICKKTSYEVASEDTNKLEWQVEGQSLYSQCPEGFDKFVEELTTTIKKVYGKYATIKLDSGMEKTARHSLELPIDKSFVWKASHGCVSPQLRHPIKAEESAAENLAKRTHRCFDEGKKND